MAARGGERVRVEGAGAGGDGRAGLYERLAINAGADGQASQMEGVGSREDGVGNRRPLTVFLTVFSNATKFKLAI